MTFLAEEREKFAILYMFKDGKELKVGNNNGIDKDFDALSESNLKEQ